MSASIRSLCALGAAFVMGGAVSLTAWTTGEGRALAQDDPAGVAAGAPGMEMDPEMAAAFADWVALGTPGKQHAAMERFLGEWSAEISMFMGGPGTPASNTMSGLATFDWMMDGRWLRLRYEGDGMLPGTRFQGFGLMGYDNFKKQYVDIWVDDMTTTMMINRGNVAPDGNTWAFFARMDEPMTGEIDKTIRTLYEWHSDDHFTMKMQEVMYGEPWTAMQIEYRRKK